MCNSNDDENNDTDNDATTNHNCSGGRGVQTSLI